MISPSVFDLYKPLRNYVRALNCEDALIVLWNYAQYYATGRAFDRDIQLPPRFLQMSDGQKQGLLSEWDIEILIKEVLLHARQPRVSPRTKDLRKLSDLARCVNKLKYFDEEMSKSYIPSEHFPTHIHRIAHQQFRWQMYEPSTMLLSRYYRLYKYPALRTLFEDAFELSLQDFYIIGMTLWGYFGAHCFLKYPCDILEIQEITPEKLDRFVKRFALPKAELVHLLEKHQQYTERFLYAYNPLRGCPLVGLNIRQGIMVW